MARSSEMKSTLNSLWSRPWPIERLLAYGCFGWGAAILGSGVYFREGASSDPWTTLLGIAIAALIGFTCYSFEGSKLSALSNTLGVTALLHVLPRIWEYVSVMKASRREMFVLFPISWLPEVTNRGLLYLFCSTSGLVLAFFAARIWVEPRLGAIRFRRFEIESGPLRHPGALTIAFLVASAVEIYFNLYLGLSASSNCAPNVRFKWLIHFFSPDIAALVVVYLLANHRKEFKPHWLAVLTALLGFYLLYTVALGSRSGLLRIGMLFLFSVLAAKPTFKLELRRIALPLVVAGVVSLLVFSLATSVRELRRVSCEDSQQPASEQEKAALRGNPIDPPAAVVTVDVGIRHYSGPASWLNKINPADLKMIYLPEGIARALDRLGTIDYAVALPSLKIDQGVKNRYFSWSYQIKAVVNNLVPGTVFADSEIMTARVHPMLYRERSIEHVNANYLSELFTLWGLGYLLGGFFGGIFFCFFSGLMISVVWILIAPDRIDPSTPSRRVCAALFLWGFVYSGFYMTQGFDYTVVCLVFFYLQLATVLAMIALLGSGKDVLRGLRS